MTTGVRVGWGVDAHRLGGPGPVILGGVRVPSNTGVLATSDGDVLAHAVTDALLGAAVLGDMGDHFPSEDSRNADSMGMLAQVVNMAYEVGWLPSHVDATVIAESTRIGPHRSGIRAGLSRVLGIDVGAVSVKATTTDGMGLLGGDAGIAAMAVVSVVARS